MSPTSPSRKRRADDAVAPWWLSGTPLEAEHKKLMAGRHPPIPWSQSTAPALSAAQRARMADTWRRRSAAEYLAISTFSVLSMDLCAAGAPADVLSLVHRAAIDEVRHAELCVRLAAIYSGVEELPPAGMSDLPDDPRREKRAQAVANALLVSCVAETVATIVLGTLRQEATDPVVNAVLGVIYADEIVHARLGWAYLEHNLRLGGDAFREVAAAMVPVAIRGAANVIEPVKVAGEPDPALRAHGLLTSAEERALFAKAVREVLLPGFAALGVTSGDAFARIAADYGDAWLAGVGAPA